MSNVIALVVGAFLIIWAFVPLAGKPSPVSYQVATSLTGTVLIVFTLLHMKKRK